MLTKSIKYKTYHLGIEILRVIMSFWVILYHCLKTNNKYLYKYILSKKFHVPTFMFISFYYFYQHLKLKNINKIKERILRLFIPYFIWPLFIWILNYYFRYNRCNIKIYLIDLLYQLTYGFKVYGIIWFNGNLILFTIFFTIISLIFRKNYINILQFISIIIYMFNCSGYIPKISEQKLLWKFLGRILGMFPIAVAGLSISSMNLLIELKKYRNRAIFICFMNIFFLIKYDIFIIKNGYVYRSILFIIAAINFFFGFALIDFNNINNRIIKIIKYITKYTGGIYYIHMIVMKNLRKKIKVINNRTVDFFELNNK